MPFYYLAHSYRHKDKSVEDERIKKATETAGSLILYGMRTGRDIKVLAPVVHNAPIYRTNNFSPEEMLHVFGTFDFHLLKLADAMIVLTLPGWRESKGVTAEIEFCKANNIPVHYLDYEDRNNDKRLKEFLS